ncbi:hypothetical protein BH23THE1_BH23THE1_19160 [soil metagenome]
MTDNNNIPKNVDNEDLIVNWIVKSLKSVKGGRVLIDVEDDPSVSINVSTDTNRINIDTLNPELLQLFNASKDEEKNSEDKDQESKGVIDKIEDKFSTIKEFSSFVTDNEKKLFDKLDIAKEFAQKLTDNNITLAILRKGHEVLVWGKDAKPTISKIISGSDDLQIKSIVEVSKFAGDLKTDENENTV